MSGKKSNLPDGRIPDRLPDGRPAVPWKSRWTEGVLPLWLVATAGGMAVIFVVGLWPDRSGEPPSRRLHRIVR
jgi:photosystem II PsbJ protein